MVLHCGLWLQEQQHRQADSTLKLTNAHAPYMRTAAANDALLHMHECENSPSMISCDPHQPPGTTPPTTVLSALSQLAQNHNTPGST